MGIRILSGTSHEPLALEICSHLGIKLTPVTHHRFKNDNLFCRIEESVREDDLFIIQTSCPPVNDNLIQLLIMIDAAKYASAKRITAVLPYYPYARSDKKDQPRVPVTARLVADQLEVAGANRILALDLHASQILGFFRIPSDHLHGSPALIDYLRKRDLSETMIVATDAGGAKWARFYASRLNLPLAVMDKRRDANNDRAQVMSVIGDVRGSHCIIMDDEISTGTSMVEAIHALELNGAKSITACAVHGVFADRAVEILDRTAVKEIVVTNTLPMPKDLPPKFTVLSVARLLADGIRRIHEGGSVSELFV